MSVVISALGIRVTRAAGRVHAGYLTKNEKPVLTAVFFFRNVPCSSLPTAGLSRDRSSTSALPAGSDRETIVVQRFSCAAVWAQTGHLDAFLAGGVIRSGHTGARGARCWWHGAEGGGRCTCGNRFLHVVLSLSAVAPSVTASR